MHVDVLVVVGPVVAGGRGVGPVVLELVAQLLVVVLVLRRGRVLKAVLLVVIAEIGMEKIETWSK